LNFKIILKLLTDTLYIYIALRSLSSFIVRYF